MTYSTSFEMSCKQTGVIRQSIEATIRGNISETILQITFKNAI